MTIAQMSHFYALCQSGSYTQAAKQLYSPSQPEQKHRGAGERTEPQAGGAQHTDSGTDSGRGRSSHGRVRRCWRYIVRG